MNPLFSITIAYAAMTSSAIAWEMGPFTRVDDCNPIVEPRRESVFACPATLSTVTWESDHTFNPAAVVKDGKVFLLYRAEDNYGVGLGFHTSRIGLAESTDGVRFVRRQDPVLYPAVDAQLPHEWPGGCEDPRIIETEDGSYIMTYTQWNRKTAVLGVASSSDLIHWTKHGYAFENAGFGRRWSKSGAIVCERCGDRLIARKINGRYWMYWGEGNVYIATSQDLINWEPLCDTDGQLVPLLERRSGKFDSGLVEAGPAPVLTERGIVMLYNGKNGKTDGDPALQPETYAAGQALIDAADPTRVLERCDECFFRPERPYEVSGQYAKGTVFIEGLVHFDNRWFLYYGTADSLIGVAVTDEDR